MRGLFVVIFGLVVLVGVGGVASLIILAFDKVDDAVHKTTEDEPNKWRHRGFL